MEKAHPYLKKRQLNAIKKRLLEEKARLTNKDSNQELFCLDKEELSDPLDEASVNIQASQELRFRNRENFYLKKINKTLERFDNNTIGFCSDCDAEISYERLYARPTAEMCIVCKEEAEMSEAHNFHQKKSKSLGKTMAELR